MSYSAEEDWLSGISYIDYTYPDLYAGLDPIYPDHYVASANNKEQQPYQTLPYEAVFQGCCRRHTQQDGTLNFKVMATVDLSDHVASARIVSMPQIYLTPDLPSQQLQLCALPAGGRASLMSMSGGTINKDDDDHMPVAFEWGVVTGRGASFSPVGGKPDGRCALLVLDGVRSAPSKDAITVSCTMGQSKVTGDFELIVPYAVSQAGVQTIGDSNPFGCSFTTDQPCYLPVTLGQELRSAYSARPADQFHPPTLSYASNLRGNRMEVRYVVGTNSLQTPLLASTQDTVVYSMSEIGEDHAGLPHGAMLGPYGQGYVTDLVVHFSASSANTRPLHDVPISAAQRDYSATVGEEAPMPEMSTPIAESNFNKGFRGATVTLWQTRDEDSAAITDLALANSSQVSMMMDMGFHKLDANLFEQSGRGELYLMFKKGSGQPLMDVSTTHNESHGYTAIRGESLGHEVVVYVMYSDDKSTLRRSLTWTPCTGDDSEIVLCAAAAAMGTELSSTMMCMLLDPAPKMPPEFTAIADPEDAPERECVIPDDGEWDAMMGRELKICFRVLHNGDRSVVRFSEESGRPEDTDRAEELLTGRTPTGAFIADVSGTQGQPTCEDAPCQGDRGMMVWTPSPYQGGWKGQVCLEACVFAEACPATPGGETEICTETCFPVSVARCRWSLVAEDSFVEIAPRFQTNWLQLWYLNPGVGHPDFALRSAMEAINIGRVYTARWDDTVDGLAVRFGVPRQRLMDLNADLIGMTDEEFMAHERMVCIIPDSCSIEPPSNSGKNQ